MREAASQSAPPALRRTVTPRHATPITVAAARPAALAARVLLQVENGWQTADTAAAELMSAGVSLRRPRTGEVMLEFACGGTVHTTVRWTATGYTSKLAVNNPGYVYQPPGAPGAPGGTGTGPAPLATAERLKTLMKRVDASRAWRSSPFQNIDLRAQHELELRLRILHRQLAEWAGSGNDDEPPDAAQAHRKLRIFEMTAVDCHARMSVERNPAGKVSSLIIETGPEPAARIEGEPRSTIRAPSGANDAGGNRIVAVWARHSAPDGAAGNARFSAGWRTLAEYGRRSMTEASDIPPWSDVMEDIATHPCWEALELQDGGRYDDRDWEPWPADDD